MATSFGMMTFEDLDLLPYHPGRHELLRGALIESPLATKRHRLVTEALFWALHKAIEKMGAEGATIGDPHHEMGYRVTRNPDSWLIPDVSISCPDQPGDGTSKAPPYSPSKSFRRPIP